jgi:hypothetical protein
MSFATAQEPDVLIYNSKEYKLFSNPLESFYTDKETRPKFLVRPHTTSTANWRGYVATWKLENDYLYLINIDAWLCEAADCQKAELKELFRDKEHDERVRADWFSGELRIPDGAMVEYVHMGYDSTYEREIILTIQSGQLISEKVIEHSKRVIPSQPPAGSGPTGAPPSPAQLPGSGSPQGTPRAGLEPNLRQPAEQRGQVSTPTSARGRLALLIGNAEYKVSPLLNRHYRV